MKTLAGKDLLRADQLSSGHVKHILSVAERFARRLEREEYLGVMKGKVLATLFYEPSTRTRLSFETAMVRLGGQVVSVADAKTTSSAAKGETLFDTGKMVASYADIAVIRHPRLGSAQELADGADIPVINGGDGTGQHPTQALLDVYTMRMEKGRLKDLTVALVGDLKNGRTIHSLVYLLVRFDIKLIFVAPPGLEMPGRITKDLREMGAEIVEDSDLNGALQSSDVVYMTRVQKERFEDPAAYGRVKGSYILDMSAVRRAKEGLTVLHPLPRVDEIEKEVDAYEGAAYFRQAANGVPVRMALLTLLTGRADCVLDDGRFS